MKSFSVILAALVLFLTVQPALISVSLLAEQNAKVADNCCADKQNTSKHTNQQKSDADCCKNGHCNNPFLSCSNSHFINHNHYSFLLINAAMQNERIRLVNDTSLSTFTQDFWHPPKLSIFLTSEQIIYKT